MRVSHEQQARTSKKAHLLLINHRMMLSSEDRPTVNAEDKFRQVDRSIKAFLKGCKQLHNAMSTKKRTWVELTNENKLSDEVFCAENVINMSSSTGLSRLRVVRSSSGCLCTEVHQCQNEMKVYELLGCPSGLYIISHGLCKEAQFIWAKRALEKYSTEEHTNLTNLHPTEDHSNIWEDSKKANDGFQGFKKLRWSCLGYHYDWTNRMYQRNLKSSFPPELATLCKHVAQQVDSDLVPEAAIVNFYPLGTSMGGHLDDAEHSLSHPIVSLSLGCAALFLIGGQAKDVAPHCILVRSGDIVIMSGESRCCYHGVPAILSEELEEQMAGEGVRVRDYVNSLDRGIDEESKVIWSYLRTNRINMNVRQVRVDALSEGEEGWVDKTGTGYVKYAF
ncbi:hypothetical protein EON65_11875 [archaeon]|nr:MAG: hypothetical protein EON65_11875 [archaeon]